MQESMRKPEADGCDQKGRTRGQVRATRIELKTNERNRGRGRVTRIQMGEPMAENKPRAGCQPVQMREPDVSNGRTNRRTRGQGSATRIQMGDWARESQATDCLQGLNWEATSVQGRATRTKLEEPMGKPDANGGLQESKWDNSSENERPRAGHKYYIRLLIKTDTCYHPFRKTFEKQCQRV